VRARAAVGLLLVVAGCHARATTTVDAAAQAGSGRSRSSGGRSRTEGREGSTRDGSTPRSSAAPSPSAAQRRYEEGLAAAARRDWTEAAAAFSDAYDLEPSTELAFNTARMFEHLADFERATQWYQRVLASNPTSAVRAQATSRLANVQRDAQRRRDGIAQAYASYLATLN